MSPSNVNSSDFDGEEPEIPSVHRQSPAAGTHAFGCVLAGFVVFLPALAYVGVLVVLLFDTLFFDDRLFFSFPDDVQAFLIWVYAPVARLIRPYLSS